MNTSPRCRPRHLIASCVAAAGLVGCSADGSNSAADTTAVPAASSTPVAAPTTSVAASTPSVEQTVASTTAPVTTAVPTTLLVTPTWAQTFSPASALAATSSVVSFYTSVSDAQFETIAVALDDGRELWRQPAAVSAVYGGIDVQPIALDDTIISLAPRSDGGDPQYSVLVGYRADTGDVLWSSEPVFTYSGAFLCDDDERAICLDAYLESDSERLSALRFDVAGNIIATASVPDGESVVNIGPDLYMTDGGFARFDRTTNSYLWEVPKQDVYGDRPANTGGGWNVALDEASQTYVVSLGAPVDVDAETLERDDSLLSMVGLDANTGEVKWIVDGVTWLCRGGFDPVTESGISQRCRDQGHFSMTKSEEGSYTITSAENLATSIEVFDMATGQTIGTPLDLVLPVGYFDIGTAYGVVYQALPPWIGASAIGAETPAGFMSLDTTTGQTAAISPDLAGWCYTESNSFTVNGGSRSAGPFSRPCTLGTRADTTTIPAPNETAGVIGGSTFVWTNGVTIFATPSA